MINPRTAGAMIGDKHTFRDFGLTMVSKSISAPVIQKNMVKISGRNGLLDMSEVTTGNVRYENREIKIVLGKVGERSDWAVLRSTLQNYMQGQRMRIVFDDDVAFYWLGRIDVDVQHDGLMAEISITADCDPYKYGIFTSEDDWLWDPFDFEQSIINELSNLEVDGELEVIIATTEKWENPIITASNAMQLEFEGNTYNLVKGSQVMYEIILTGGNKTLKFIGNGNVSINYFGGSL